MLRRILLTALAAGLLSGLAAFVLQQARVVPLIRQAEIYETRAALTQTAVAHAQHHPDGVAEETAPAEEDWEPAPGLERLGYTLMTDLLAGVGFGLILAGTFVLYEVAGGRIDARRGVLWGLSGFVVFAAAPALGLPPEPPGSAAAALGDRQVWWIATAAATALGLGLTIFSKVLSLRVLGVAALLVPHLIGAPHPVDEAGSVPATLAADFAIASLATAAAFWAVLGGLGGWVYHRLGMPEPVTSR